MDILAVKTIGFPAACFFRAFLGSITHHALFTQTLQNLTLDFRNIGGADNITHTAIQQGTATGNAFSVCWKTLTRALSIAS